MSTKITTLLCGLAACAFLSSARAAIITYDVAPVSGNSWVYSYELTNDGQLPIEEFSIFFDLDLYSNLSVASTAGGWDSIVLQPDLNLPDDGLFDALADLGSALSPGLSVGGFSVRFDFLGTGTPGSQAFDILRLDPFGVIQSGVTRPRIVAVAEPGILALLLIGGLFVAAGPAVRVSRRWARSQRFRPSK